MTKFVLRTLLSIRRCYWWVLRPTTRGVRAIVINKEQKILLLRHRYGTGWFLPGGKSKKTETNESALRRELKEEVGITLIIHIKRLGEYINTYEYKKDTITVFIVYDFNLVPKKHFEIEEWAFFNTDALPDDTSPGTRKRIEEWKGERAITSEW